MKCTPRFRKGLLNACIEPSSRGTHREARWFLNLTPVPAVGLARFLLDEQVAEMRWFADVLGFLSFENCNPDCNVGNYIQRSCLGTFDRSPGRNRCHYHSSSLALFPNTGEVETMDDCSRALWGTPRRAATHRNARRLNDRYPNRQVDTLPPVQGRRVASGHALGGESREKVLRMKWLLSSRAGAG